MLLLLIKLDIIGEATFDISRPFRNDFKGLSFASVAVTEFDFRVLRLCEANGLLTIDCFVAAKSSSLSIDEPTDIFLFSVPKNSSSS